LGKTRKDITDMAMTCGDITLMAKTRKVKTNKGLILKAKTDHI